ncbi:MAG TPA: hypothetical protein DCF68_02495 [Cyanothece sp. UBA12306]|nr:hypothetical protein [Cyanothece sp. UBA12306]
MPQEHTDALHALADESFKSHCVKISRLLSEVWLNTENGKTFQEDIKTMSLGDALKNQGIDLHSDFLRYELDTSSYNGSLIPEEILDRGLNFVWYLPYAPCPTEASMNRADIEDWITTTTKWLEKAEEDPNLPFPVPPNPYIPLATT